MNAYHYDLDELSAILTRIAGNIDDRIVSEHVRKHAYEVSHGVIRLPAGASEKDDALRNRIIDVLGPPTTNSYMSEECGWDLTPLVEDNREGTT